MKIKTILLIYFAILFALSLCTTTVAHHYLKALPKSIKELEIFHRRQDFISRLQVAIERSLMPPNDFLTHGDVQEKKNFDALNAQVKTMFAIAESIKFSDEEQRVLDHVKDRYASVEKIAGDILSLKYPTLRITHVSDMMEEMDAIAEESVKELDYINTNLHEEGLMNLHNVARLNNFAQSMTIASLLFAIGLGFSICIVSVRTFTRPLGKIFNGVRYFTQGNLSQQIDIESPYEFKQLATELNQMSHNIQTVHTRLEESQQVWEDTFDTITDAVSIHDKDCNIINVNAAYMEMTKMRREELRGKKCYEVIHCTTGPIKDCPAVKVMETMKPQVFDIEDEQQQVDLRVYAYPMIGRAGDCIGVVHLIRDVTENRKLERELIDYRVNLEQRVGKRTTEVKELLIGAVDAMATAVDKKSPWTANHSKRVSCYAINIANALQMKNDSLEKLKVASLLHDIGKIGVPDALLNSPEHLGEKDLSIIREHTVYGADIIKNVSHFDYAVSGILHHHEFFDGRGTPLGLSGEEIPLTARIIAVADAYDAMTSERPYRRSLSHDEAIAELKKCSGTQFDPKIVDAFIKSISSSHKIT